VLEHPPYSLDLAPGDYWLLAHVKEYLQGKWFEFDVNIAVTATVHRLSKDVHRAAPYLPHKSEKCVDSAGDYNEYMFWNIIRSVIILYFVIKLRSYTKLLKWPTYYQVTIMVMWYPILFVWQKDEGDMER
jgi:hypothetical protein